MVLIALLISISGRALGAESQLWRNGILPIPYPQVVEVGGEDYNCRSQTDIQIDKGTIAEDVFTAEELSRQFHDQWSIDCRITEIPSQGCIVLTRDGAPEKAGEQGCGIKTSAGRLILRANDAAGMFIGVQSLLQLIQKGRQGPFVNDWPEISWHKAHYDTKHFQEKKEYVIEFICTLGWHHLTYL